MIINHVDKIDVQILEYGRLTTVGCTHLGNNISTEDSPLVVLYKEHGAIPMVKGNLPQHMMIGHTDNLIFGLARNPFDESRSVGGSSGGDAGLVASKCVPFAIGTDIGGSIRGPAAFNGIVGFKPTSSRSCFLGHVGLKNVNSPIMAAAGPLCKTVDDVVNYCEMFFSDRMFELDPSVAPLKWDTERYNQVLENKKLRVGYLAFTEGGVEKSGIPCLPPSKAN